MSMNLSPADHASLASSRTHAPAEARAARRERLLLLCAVDRARLRLVWRMPEKPRPEPVSLAAGLLSPPALAALLPWVPGKIGRWSRRLRTGASLLRTVLRVAT